MAWPGLAWRSASYSGEHSATSLASLSSSAEEIMNRREFIGGAAGLGAALAFPAGSPPRMVPSQVPSDIVDFSASQLSAAIRQRLVSCEEVMRAYLQPLQVLNYVIS